MDSWRGVRLKDWVEAETLPGMYSEATILMQDFETTLDAWMEEFHKLLVYENANLAPSKGSDKSSPVDAVKAAVCQNITLLVNRDEEEFSKFLQIIVQDVWTQLIRVSNAPNQASRASSPLDSEQPA